MITPRQALIIQVVDDSDYPMTGREVADIASRFISTQVEDIRHVLIKGFIKRKPSSGTDKGGYVSTEKGARELLSFEKTVKAFLDVNTHKQKKPLS